MKTLLRALLFIGLSPLASAGAPTLGDVQTMCTSPNQADKKACTFYINGIAQGIAMGILIADGKTDAKRQCVPEKLSFGAIEIIVKMALGQDLMVFPADKDLEASGAIGAVLSSKFPCKGNAK